VSPDVVVKTRFTHRVLAVGLGDAVSVKVLSPVPDMDDTPSHVALPDTDHDWFDDTDTCVDPPDEETGHDRVDKLKLAVTIPRWNIATLAVAAGDPQVDVNVTVADRASVDVFGSTINDTDPFP